MLSTFEDMKKKIKKYTPKPCKMNHLNCTKSTLHKNLFAPPSINENHSFLSCLLRGNKNDYYLYNGYNHVLKTLKKYLSVKIMVNRFAPWNIFSVVWVKKIYIKKCSYSRKKISFVGRKNNKNIRKKLQLLQSQKLN